MKFYRVGFFILIIGALSVFSYGFVDSNMPDAPFTVIRTLRSVLFPWVLMHRMYAAGIYCLFVAILFGTYMTMLRPNSVKNIREIHKPLFVTFALLILSYSAFSYDIFNYMLTAKVAYTYKENPYVVMPVEIPNDPNLAFTRAANKVALYGPTWIGFTFIPHILSGGNPWVALITYKTAVALVLGVFLWFLRKETGSVRSVLFFAFNPLVLVEVLSSGHNDILMMTLALIGATVFYNNRTGHKLFGLILILLSVFVKGATIVLFPLLFIAKTKERFYVLGFWVMLAVFFITPLREELYPWYSIWFLSFAALIPFKKDSVLHWFCIWFSFGLLLRHAPYILLGKYEGQGSTLRTAITLIGPLVYTTHVLIRTLRKNIHA